MIFIGWVVPVGKGKNNSPLPPKRRLDTRVSVWIGAMPSAMLQKRAVSVSIYFLLCFFVM